MDARNGDKSLHPVSERIASQRLPQRFESMQVGLSAPYCELFAGRSRVKGSSLEGLRHSAASTYLDYGV